MVTGAEARSVQQDEEMLAALGYEPVGFTSAVAALEAARCASERFDLLMIDAKMPRMGGLELASRLHQLLPGRPVILTTHLAGELQAARLAQAGIAEVLPRPWRSATLARTLEGCLAQAVARRETLSVDPS
jgi:CheY-like chemotaxis protein